MLIISVDEYVVIAKEKHGYNTEQVIYKWKCSWVLFKNNVNFVAFSLTENKNFF